MAASILEIPSSDVFLTRPRRTAPDLRVVELADRVQGGEFNQLMRIPLADLMRGNPCPEASLPSSDRRDFTAAGTSKGVSTAVAEQTVGAPSVRTAVSPSSPVMPRPVRRRRRSGPHARPAVRAPKVSARGCTVGPSVAAVSSSGWQLTVRGQVLVMGLIGLIVLVAMVCIGMTIGEILTSPAYLR